jgi:hypothetical protein
VNCGLRRPSMLVHRDSSYADMAGLAAAAVMRK